MPRSPSTKISDGTDYSEHDALILHTIDHAKYLWETAAPKTTYLGYTIEYPIAIPSGRAIAGFVDVQLHGYVLRQKHKPEYAKPGTENDTYRETWEMLIECKTQRENASCGAIIRQVAMYNAYYEQAQDLDHLNGRSFACSIVVLDYKIPNVRLLLEHGLSVFVATNDGFMQFNEENYL